MTWMWKPGAVRVRREAREMTKAHLGRMAGISERQLRKIESRSPPGGMQQQTLKALAKALRCADADLAVWTDEGSVAPPPVALPPPVVVVSPVALPPLGTLAERAQRERELGQLETVGVGGMDLEVLGLDRLKRCFARPAKHNGQRFAVRGVVDDIGPMPDHASKVLGVEAGSGARFRVVRQVAEGLPFYATVFTRTVEQTDALETLYDSREPVTLVAEVVHAPAKEDWKGFFIFERPPRPRPFAFVARDFA